MRGRKLAVAGVVGGLLVIGATVLAGMWWVQPLAVHEWGVNIYDLTFRRPRTAIL